MNKIQNFDIPNEPFDFIKYLKELREQTRQAMELHDPGTAIYRNYQATIDTIDFIVDTKPNP